MSKILDRAGLGASISANQNDANLSSLSGINEAQTSTSYTMTIDDQNRTIEHSNGSAIAVTLTEVGTITGALHTDDFRCIHKNIGAGAVTLTCGGSDTFDNGDTTLVLKQYDFVEIQTDSTGAIWNVIRKSYDNDETFTNPTIKTTAGLTHGSRVIIETLTASSSSSLDFTNNIDSTYTYYLLEIKNLLVSATADVNLRVSNDGGSTFESGATDYYSGGNSQSSFPLTNVSTVSSTAAHGGLNGWVGIFNPESSSYFTLFNSNTVYANGATAVFGDQSYGGYVTAETIDAIQLIPSTGNFVSGTATLYGLV